MNTRVVHHVAQKLSSPCPNARTAVLSQRLCADAVLRYKLDSKQNQYLLSNSGVSTGKFILASMSSAGGLNTPIFQNQNPIAKTPGLRTIMRDVQNGDAGEFAHAQQKLAHFGAGVLVQCA